VQEEWTRELDKNGLNAAYLGGEATRQLFVKQAEQLRAILAELGLAK
jgi:tripartite-type tricarboxylate transporter receptor subunit TctC